MARKPRISVEAVTEQAVEVLTAFLESDGTDSGLAARAKVAVSVLGVYARLLAGRTVREMATFTMARELAPEPADLRQLLGDAMPNSAVVQALPGRLLTQDWDTKDA